MRPSEGLRSEGLKVALRDALAGRTAGLEDFFARYGGGPDARPNLKLAAAFGDEMMVCEGAAAKLLSRLAADDAAPDERAVFLPMAAAFGWVGRLRADEDIDLAWDALRDLAGDERVPVRVAAHAALHAYAVGRAGAGTLVARANDWLDAEDREVRYGATSVVLEVLSDRQALSAVPRLADALDYLSRTIAEAADAPRSAERSDGRRRLLAALPRALASAVAVGAEVAVTWLEAECAAAIQPNMRSALSDTVVRVQGLSAVLGQRVRHALEGSAKPLRDPTRKRPGSDRGKSSRPTR